MSPIEPTAEDFELLGLIYQTASNEGSWAEVLARLVDATGSGGAIIALVDDRYVEANVSHTTHSKGVIEEYISSYLVHDRLDAVLDAPSGRIVTDEDVWPDRQSFRENPLVKWRTERLGLPHSWGANLNNGEGWKDCVIFQCAENPWPVPESALQRFRLFHSHIARAIQLYRLRAIVEAKYRMFVAALDWLDLGVLILDGSRRVVAQNEEARRISEECGGFVLRNGKLRVTSSACDARMTELVVSSQLTERADLTHAGGVCRLKCRRTTCLAEVMPLGDPELAGGVVVFLMDPAHESSFRADGLELLYGLSPSENEVSCLLARGLTNPDIAEARNVSLETVKSQVASVLAKTGRKGRMDLLRLMVKINPPLRV